MPEVKCKIPSKEDIISIDPCFEKSSYMQSILKKYEKSQGWVFPGPVSFVPVSIPSFEDVVPSKQIDSLREKIDNLLSLLRDMPLIKNTILRDLNSEKYSLKENIEIIIEEYQDEIIALWPEIEAFGHGITQPEAILNLKNEIIDLYEDLSNTKEKELGRLPKMWLRILKKVIKKNE
jgi:hypothetical protein